MNGKLYAEIFSWVKTLVVAVISALFITNVIIVNAEVPTGSMESNIMPGDRLIANRLAYLGGEPQRYDVVVFRYPDNRKTLYVKRIIGMPGEKVDIVDGKVYINNSQTPLDDSFIKEPMNIEENLSYEVPENSYFMLGDNRNNSADSRFWVNKFVNRNEILGKVAFRYFPSFRLYDEVKS